MASKIGEGRVKGKGKRALRRVYEKLLRHYVAQNWWPAESSWEIMVGAILTQNTSWKNVERALDNLKRANALAAAPMRELDMARLTELVRSAGFTTSKPKRLKRLVEHLFQEYEGDAGNLRGRDLESQRAQLLALNGIGPETADAILLYAAEQPVFVIDAYTRRIFARMGIWQTENGVVTERVPYHELQALFMDALPHETELFQEFHALLDIHAKYTCTRRAPRCGECPLERMCLKVGVEGKGLAA